MTHEDLYESVGEIIDGADTDVILTVLGHHIVDVFSDSLFNSKGEELTDKQFIMYAYWLKHMYEAHKPINHSGVLH